MNQLILGERIYSLNVDGDILVLDLWPQACLIQLEKQNSL